MKKQSVDSASLSNAAKMRVGIIAGSGSLPLALAATLRARGEAPYLLLVEGEADVSHYADYPHEVIRITKVGRFLKALARENCTHITLAGPVKRPDLKNLVPDMEGVKLLGRITGAARKGDDGLMRAITTYIQEKGFTVVGVHELADNLLVPAGQLGKISPTERDTSDIAEGIRIVKAIGALDIGQAAIIRDGYVLAIEAAEGTDRLLARSSEFAWEEPAGVLVKLSKPGQELAADMPTIGPETVTLAAEAHLRGIAVEAGLTLVLDLKETLRRADDADLFVVGLDPQDISG
ncbi:LpxI family protein [Sneathiella sp.]|uniref:LpxI family protein n=1 Tax=Sneathiella sp. TaxID=1964365 RepID=UPI00262071E6|nr:UDP-2,3-diacylglucosamine diphosphatase LpxI [Sneathiella sp.]MDF2368710.1 UDP-2,3-diacylglucosamine diphosphatase LpxI [Sneathiella sp.]